MRSLVVGAVMLTLSGASFAQGQFGTEGEAKVMLEKVVAAVKADKGKALDMFNRGEGGFKDRDLYPFCANVSADGSFTAHPTLKGTRQQDVVDKNGFRLGEEIRKVATEGKVAEVSYMWPRPGADATPVRKISFVTKIGDQICGVGYYK